MFLIFAACQGVDPSPADTDPATVDTDVFDTDAVDTDTDADTDTVPPHRPEALDCGPNPPFPDTFESLPNLGPHEDFTFDTAGNLVGVDIGGNLSAQPIGGPSALLSPGIGEAKGTRFLPDGSVVIAKPDNGTITKVAPDGARTVLANVQAPNGIAIDHLGNTWVATSNGTVERITPDGDRTVLVDLNVSFDGITFSPDFRTVYFNSEFGNIRKLELDDFGEPLGGPEDFASVPLVFALLDGMTADMCGNVYVARMDGRVFRFLPDGTPDGVLAVSANPGIEVVPAINFGSGVGGFDRDKLYAMNFLGGVIVADIGIDGRWEPHYPIP